MSVSDSPKSACRSGTTGGIANTVSRKQAPQSQSRTNAVARWPADSEELFSTMDIRERLAKELRLSSIRRCATPQICHRENSGAGEGIRTLDPNLGKVVLYP